MSVSVHVPKLDAVTITLITAATLVFAYGMTLISENTWYATLCMLGLTMLLAGMALGNVIHGYQVDMKLGIHEFQNIQWGLAGVGFVALAQMPALLAGLSIYELSASPLDTVLFLVAQAVAEECFFANYLYEWFKRTAWTVWHASLSVAIIFTAFHWAVYSQNTLVLLAVFLSRLTLNWIYERAGLTGSAITHVIVNFIAGVVG